MSNTYGLGRELDGLREELGRIVGEGVDAAYASSREKIDDAAKVLGTMLDEVEQIVAREEEQIERFISSRPIMSVAAAFAVGIALGYLMRRR